MFNFTIIEKAFVSFTKRLDYSTLEHLVLTNNKAFDLAFSVWDKLDIQAQTNHHAMEAEWDYYNRLGGALQI